MPTALEVLARDHEEVKRMLAELELGPTAATGADSDQLALRKKMVQQLVIEESRHEAAEEEYFWPAVRKRLEDGSDLANQAVEQEREGKRILSELDKLTADDDKFEILLAQFITVARTHIAFEEAIVWPDCVPPSAPGRPTTSAASSRRPRRRHRRDRTRTLPPHQACSRPPEPGNEISCENGRMRLNRVSLGNASHHGRISRAGVADSSVPAAPVTGALRHVGFFYRTMDEYARTVAAFLRAGIAVGEPAFAAVPPGKLGVIMDALGSDARHIGFADMTLLGRNPAWIIPRVREFTGRHAGRRVRYLDEPIWASRNAAELREATRHEALINLAFAAADAEILCPYDAAELDPAILADARRTHPALLTEGRLGVSPGYAVPFRIPSSCSLPLSPPPRGAMFHPYRSNLSEVRALVLEHARAAGLPEARANDLVLAVSEVAANTLRHTSSDGTLTIWHDRAEIVCEVRDKGIITDPLAGRRRPPQDANGGHGLWLVHQVCDLVELRSDTSGTTVRMHMAIRPRILPA